MEMAKAMAQKSALALQLTKSALNMALNGMNYEDTVLLEDRNQTVLNLALSNGIETSVRK